MIFDIRKCSLQMIGVVLLLLVVTMLGRAQITDVLSDFVEVMSVNADGKMQVCKYDSLSRRTWDCRLWTAALQAPSWNPVQPDNKPFRTEEYRAAVEQKFQALYEELVPGVKVHLYSRGDQFILIFKLAGQSDIIHAMNVENVDDPQTLWKGIIQRVDSPRVRKQAIRRK